MVETGTIVLMLVFAALAIHTRLLRLAIVHLAVVSLLGAFLYFLYAAPELAIAEAVIGSGLVTLLYLAALKRNRVYTIVLLSEGHKYRLTDAYVGYIERSRAVRDICRFFELREMEPQIIYSSATREDALQDPAFDFVIVEEKEAIAIYGREESFVIEELELVFRMHGTESDVRFYRYTPEGSL